MRVALSAACAAQTRSVPLTFEDRQYIFAAVLTVWQLEVDRIVAYNAMILPHHPRSCGRLAHASECTDENS